MVRYLTDDFGPKTNEITMCDTKWENNDFKNFAHLPELEITPLNFLPKNCTQNVGDKSVICKKTKMPREQVDIHRLLMKLPMLYEYFDIHKKIGEGTYSSVYLATFKNTNGLKKYAIKHLTQNFSLPRIQKELKFMQTIGGQDNVVSVLNCLKNGSDDCIVFVMPYLEHKRFSEYVLQMDAHELREYMKNLFIALRRVHTFNVIHRDVKPGNFLYNRETKQFLLVDFGLAQQIENFNKERQVIDIADGENMPIDYSKRKRSPSDRGDQPNKILSPLMSCENIMSSCAANKGSRLAHLTSPVVTPSTNSNVEMTPLKSRSHTSSSMSSSSRKKLFCDESLSVISNNSNRRSSSIRTSLLKTKSENKTSPTPPDRFINKEQRSFTPLVAIKTNVGSFVQVRNSQVVAQKQSTCLCANVGTICSSCQNKRAMNAPRAGTPGFRPPEVLLKHLHQTTAVDMWAAGVIMLCILSGCYPFFKSPSDLSALVEIMTIFGKEAVEKVAAKFGRKVSCSVSTKPIDLRKMCRRMRDRRMKTAHKNAQERTKCDECKQSITEKGCLCYEEKVQPINSCSDGDHFPDSAYHLLLRLLDLDPASRITAAEALNHPFITQD